MGHNQQKKYVKFELKQKQGKWKLNLTYFKPKLNLFKTWLMPAQLTCMEWKPRKLSKQKSSKDKLQLINAIPQYYKQQQGQINRLVKQIIQE